MIGSKATPGMAVQGHCPADLTRNVLNPLIATLKSQSNGPSYSNIVIGTLVVDDWAVTFGTARRGPV